MDEDPFEETLRRLRDNDPTLTKLDLRGKREEQTQTETKIETETERRRTQKDLDEKESDRRAAGQAETSSVR